MKVSSAILIKILLSIEIFFILLSPKAVKGLIGYEGPYPNPQFLFLLLIIPILVYLKAYEFNRLKKFYDLLLLALLIVFFYFLSSFISITTLHVDYYYPLSESIRQFFNYIFIFFTFLLLRPEYLIYVLKFIVFYGLLNFVFVIYGILAFFQILKAPEFLLETIRKNILAQSWTIFGFTPKWGGLFPETQVLSTFYLMCYISVDLLEAKVGKKKVFGLYKLLFGASIILLLSKSTVPAFIFYLIFKRFYSKRFYLALMTPIIMSYPVIAVKDEIYKLLDNRLVELALSYSSIGERVFHIIKAFEYMGQSIIRFFFGLGPRTYGYLLSLEYPHYFNEYSNTISVFNVFSDIGIIGFSFFLIFLTLIFMKIKDKVLRICYIAILLTYLPQVAWGDSFVYLFISLLVNYSFKFSHDEIIHRRLIL